MKWRIWCPVFLGLIILSYTNANAFVHDTDYYYDTKRNMFYVEKLPGYYWIKVDLVSEQTEKTISENYLFRRVLTNEFLVRGDSQEIVTNFLNVLVSIQPLYKTLDVTSDHVVGDSSVFGQDSIRIINNMLYIKPKEGGENYSDLLTFLWQQDLEIVEQDDEWYWVLQTKLGVHNLHLSQKLVELGLVDFAWCEFYGKPIYSYTPPDPFYSQQFYLKNTGQTVNNSESGDAGADINIEPAWEYTLGNPNIRIAVIDDGISQDHPDLPVSKQVYKANCTTGNYIREANAPGLTFDPNRPAWNRPDDPSPSLFLHASHGTAVTGIISAEHNGEGVAGIAPECSRIGIKIQLEYVEHADQINEDYVSRSLRVAMNGNPDVINCSWNYPPDHKGNVLPQSLLSYVIENITTKGRKGRGTVVVFCMGNDGIRNRNASYPTSLSIPGLIGVGATDMNDQRVAYSNYGVGCDLVAPSGFYPTTDVGMRNTIWTCDIPGPYGYNPWANRYGTGDDPSIGVQNPSNGTNYEDYTGYFSGTSASAPQVAGVAGLMLSLNPCMTAEEVEVVLKRNAFRLKGYNYVNGRVDEVGYGRLDAFSSVLDISYEQNINYPGLYNLKSGAIKSGNNVTNTAAGNVVVGNMDDVHYRASNFIELQSGFETQPGASFSAATISENGNCAEWDEFSLKLLSETEVQSVIRDKPYQFLNAREGIADRLSYAPTRPIVNEPVVKLYPNPAKESVFVEVSVSNAQGYIYDFQGKQLIIKDLENGRNSIHLDNLEQGLYFFVVCAEGKVMKGEKLSIVK